MAPSSNTTISTSRLTALILMFGMMMATSTFPQFLFGAVGPFVIDHFDLTRFQFGTITTVLFAVASLSSPLMGTISARVSARVAYVTLVAIAALAASGFAASVSYVHLLVFAGVAGTAMALANPVTNRMVPEAVPHQHRGLVIGFKQSGVQLGAFFTGILIPWFVVTAGWRQTLGGVAIVMLLVGGSFLPLTPRRATLGSEETKDKRGMLPSARTAVTILAVYSFVLGSATAAVTNYLPLYGVEMLGLSSPAAGALVAVMASLGVASRIALGHVSYRVSDLPRLLAGLALLASVALVLMLMALNVHPTLVWFGALAFGLSLSWNSVAMVAVVRSREIATSIGSGFVMLGFYGGFILIPPGFGSIVDVTGSYAAPWTAMALLLCGTGLTLRLLSGRVRLAF